MQSTVLILTATIAPNSVMVSRRDTQDRASDYAAALEFYTTYFSDIHFIENSAFDISTHERLAEATSSSGVKVYRYPPSGEKEKGKGYQEFEMMDAHLAAEGRRFDSYIKVSGRYICTNISSLAHQWSRRPEAQMMIDRHRKMRVAITGVFACRKEFYREQLMGRYAEADDSNGRYIEHVLYDELEDRSAKEIQMWYTNPLLMGISGSYGGSLRRHPIKMALRNVERRLLKACGLQEFKFEY